MDAFSGSGLDLFTATLRATTLSPNAQQFNSQLLMFCLILISNHNKDHCIRHVQCQMLNFIVLEIVTRFQIEELTAVYAAQLSITDQ